MATATKIDSVYGHKTWTPQGVLSYPSLFEPRVNEYKQNRLFYQATILIPKVDMFEELAAEMQRISEIAFGAPYRKLSSHTNCAIRDGDKLVDKDGILKTGHAEAGCWVISASTGESKPPMIIDRNGRPITNKNEIYGGCIGQLLVTPATYKVTKNFGVSLYLVAFMKLADGESFSGSSGFNPVLDMPKTVEVSPHLRGRMQVRPSGVSAESDADRIMKQHFDATRTSGHIIDPNEGGDDGVPF